MAKAPCHRAHTKKEQQSDSCFNGHKEYETKDIESPTIYICWIDAESECLVPWTSGNLQPDLAFLPIFVGVGTTVETPKLQQFIHKL